MFILKTIIIINLFLVAVFVFYHLFFVICYFFLKIFRIEKGNFQRSTPRLNKFAIIVPAHNEEKIIGELLNSVKNLDYPNDLFDLFVIADNCTDNTALIARKGGAICYERVNNERRGKPYALNWILQQIELDKYDAFTIIDADTAIDEKYLKTMNQFLNRGCAVIQGYFGLMNPDDSWLTKLGVIPGILKFKIRYHCKEALGLSCPLMGNGMCFSRDVIQKLGWEAYSITENWEYYIQLLLNNYIVHFAEEAYIYSHAVTALSHGETQRKRWTRGILGVLIDYWRSLVIKFFQQKKIRFLDSLLELTSPSYSMLLIWSVLILLFTIVLFMNFENYHIFFILSVVLTCIQIIYFLVALIISKSSIKTWLLIPYLPLFLLWKFMVTAKALIAFKNVQWMKTERKL